LSFNAAHLGAYRLRMHVDYVKQALALQAVAAADSPVGA
jgi:hypothetical protein